METGLLRLETEKIPYDTKYASPAPFGQTTESPASLPLSTDCPSCPSDYLLQTRQPDSHHMIFVCAVPSAWNALPIAAGKGCSSVLPQDSAEALSFQGVFSTAHSSLSSKS